MERIIPVSEAGEIFGQNFVGKEELVKCCRFLGNLVIPDKLPDIPYSAETLIKFSDDYLLILGINETSDGGKTTIKNLRNRFGTNPNDKEPCFYNQDWYLNEPFVDRELDTGWFLIRKTVYVDSRGMLPETLEKRFIFPTAIQCCYSFFVSWYCLNEILWRHDFIWCSDKDHNGDRIYVGKYHDVDGINANGFSIHRHLSLRECYGGINIL